MKSAPLVLLVWDGFGCGLRNKSDATFSAGMPHFSQLKKQFPSTQLDASGAAVGLAPRVIGNSEVGHLTLGAGAIIPSLQQCISTEVSAGRLAQHPLFAQMRNRTVHMIGLLSDGGVHSNLTHLRACVAAAHQQGATKILFHAILDGRDVSPHSAATYLTEFETWPAVQLASVQGRFYAMDRDNNYERTALGAAVLRGEGRHAQSWQEALEKSYAAREYDEFVMPTVLSPQGCHSGLSGNHLAVNANDIIFFANTRADRMRQLVSYVRNSHEHCIGLAEYSSALTERGVRYLYKPQSPATTLLHQLTTQHPQWRIGLVAETEKYAHITYFFDGRREESRDNVAYSLLASQKEESHAHRPAMRAEDITDQICSWADEKECIIANYANADMVGHSGDLAATIDACGVLDRQLKILYDDIVVERGGTIVLTSDHGNAEEMHDAEGRPCTSHTTNRVPFLLLRRDLEGIGFAKDVYGLANVAPTVLQLLGCVVPPEMAEVIAISNVFPYSVPTQSPFNQ